MQDGVGPWEGCYRSPGTRQQRLRQANSWSMPLPAGALAFALASAPVPAPALCPSFLTECWYLIDDRVCLAHSHSH